MGGLFTQLTGPSGYLYYVSPSFAEAFKAMSYSDLVKFLDGEQNRQLDLVRPVWKDGEAVKDPNWRPAAEAKRTSVDLTYDTAEPPALWGMKLGDYINWKPSIALGMYPVGMVHWKPNPDFPDMPPEDWDEGPVLLYWGENEYQVAYEQGRFLTWEHVSNPGIRQANIVAYTPTREPVIDDEPQPARVSVPPNACPLPERPITPPPTEPKQLQRFEYKTVEYISYMAPYEMEIVINEYAEKGWRLHTARQKKDAWTLIYERPYQL
jgi:hypothetical protein